MARKPAARKQSTQTKELRAILREIAKIKTPAKPICTENVQDARTQGRKMNNRTPVINPKQDKIVERTAQVLLCRASHQTLFDLLAYHAGCEWIDPENCEYGNTAEHRTFYTHSCP